MPVSDANIHNAEQFRADFPILEAKTADGVPIAYLDNAASTQRPQEVLEAMDDCYRNYYANVHRGIHTLSELSTERFERARQTVADFLNTETLREVIFTSGTTGAINLVARSWGDQNVSAGDNLLITMAEHHANIVPWQQLAARKGAHLHFHPLTDDGRLDLQLVETAIATQRPKIFAFTAVSNVLGTVNPVEELVAIARKYGVTTLVDAAQAAPHGPIDVRRWNADFVVFSGHKICGPTGIGVLYGREEILADMPPFLGGGAMIHRVTTSGFEPAALPEKFEAGTPPIVEAIGLDAAIQYLRRVGLSTIRDYERVLTERAEQGLRQICGVHILGPAIEHKAGMVSFVIDGVHAHDVAQWLDTYGVAIRAGHHCAMPLHQSLGIAASSRASFYFYNTVAEVDLFIQAVAETVEKFSRKGRKRSPSK
jgi:cysteine desulfurase/selenocysteine lyase